MVKLRVNSVDILEGYKSYSITSSIELFCSSFSLVLPPLENDTYPIKIGDKLEILEDSKVVFIGRVEVFKTDITLGNHTIYLEGRSLGGDLIDSSITFNSQSKNIKQVLEEGISELGLDLKVESDIELDSFLIQPPIDYTYLDLINDFSKDIGCLIFERLGTIYITRVAKEINPNDIEITKKSNVKAASIIIDHSKRFNTYTAFNSTIEEPNKSYLTKDEKIRSSRKRNFISKLANTDKRYIEFIKNLQEVRSSSYSYTLTQITYQMEINQNVKVLDKLNNIKGIFLIKSKRIEKTLGGGTVTRLELAKRDGYSIEKLPKSIIERSSKYEE